MTLEETKKLLITINALYPNWKVDNPEATSAAWHWALQDYPGDGINAALQIFLKTDKSGFAPSVSQLIACMYKPVDNDQMSEGEAWNIVKRALQDSTYHANEHFDKFPENIKKAVGSANMLQQWAQSETGEVNTVIMSNFQRAYRTVCERERFTEKIPDNLSNLVKGLVDQTKGERLIGTNET